MKFLRKGIRILLVLIIFLLIVFVMVKTDQSSINIQWLDYHIELGFYLLLALWISSILLLFCVLYIIKIPLKLSQLLKLKKSGQSVNSFNKAIRYLLNHEHQKSIQSLILVDKIENRFEAQLLCAYNEFKEGNLHNMQIILKKLKNNHPHENVFLNTLQINWLFNLADYLSAYELATVHLNSNDKNPYLNFWFNLLSCSDILQKMNDWENWLPIAKKSLNKKEFHLLETQYYLITIAKINSYEGLIKLWKEMDKSFKNEPNIHKIYLNKINDFVESYDYYNECKNLLTTNWDNEWLWQLVNYKSLNNFHQTFEWLEKNPPKNEQNELYFLSMAILSARAKLWTISENYLVKIEKNSDSKTDAIIILLRAWIEAQINNEYLSKQWITLMHKNSMHWV